MGTGVGPIGCTPTSSGGGSTGGGVVNPCDHVNCVNGNCIANFAGSPICVCNPGYTGILLSGHSMAVSHYLFFSL
jgi:hypothetical protein